MTKAQNIKFLMDLGVPKDRAEKMCAQIPDSATATPDTEVDEAFQSITTHQSELFVNGDVYKKAIKDVGDKKLGETMTKVESKIVKIAGLTAEEIKDKKFDDIVDLAFKKIGASTDKSTEEVQLELRKVSDELKKVREEEIPSIQKQVDVEKALFREDTALMKLVGGIKLRAGVDMDDALILIRQKAAKLGYKLKVDEKFNVEFTTEDGNKIMTDDKKTFRSTGDVVGVLLGGQIEKSKADNKDDKDKIIKTDDNKDKDSDRMGSTVNHNLEKAKAHAKKLAEQTAAAK